MSKIRNIAMSFFAFALIFSSAGFNTAIVRAKDSTSAPVLKEVDAENTGGTSSAEAGDSVTLEFSESTNKFAITAGNIGSVFTVSNGHSFLDGAGNIGSATWSDDGEKLTVIFSAGTSFPSIVPGDKVSIIGANIKDINNNVFTGIASVSGSFFTDSDSGEDCGITPTPTPNVSPTPTPSPTATPSPSATPTTGIMGVTRQDNDKKDKKRDVEKAEGAQENENEDGHGDDCGNSIEEHGKYRCGAGLQNGLLYKLANSPTVYLLAGCRFKPFRGQAAFKSRGLKFQDIQALADFPAGMIISDKPVVPAEGTLIKGSDKTVWFVDKNGKRRGFTSEEVFKKLGFSFEKVDQIEDTDLNTVSEDTPISTDVSHPDGALIKCGNSKAVFAVIGNMRFPFADAEAFQERGHRFDHVLTVDCGRFAYKEGAAITQ